MSIWILNTQNKKQNVLKDLTRNYIQMIKQYVKKTWLETKELEENIALVWKKLFKKEQLWYLCVIKNKKKIVKKRKSIQWQIIT